MFHRPHLGCDEHTRIAIGEERTKFGFDDALLRSLLGTIPWLTEQRAHAIGRVGDVGVHGRLRDEADQFHVVAAFGQPLCEGVTHPLCTTEFLDVVGNDHDARCHCTT